MKTLKTLFALSLVTFFLSSYVVPVKDAKPVPYVTFVNDAGEQTTKSLLETTSNDWKDNVKHAEFKKGETIVEVEGLVVYSPKDGEVKVWWYKDSKTFVTIMQKIATDHTLIPGDRFILDNIKIVGEKKNISPIVHTLK